MIRKLIRPRVLLVVLPLVAIVVIAVAQPPMGRTHTIITAGKLNKVPATSRPPVNNEVNISRQGNDRVIESNGVPEHNTGSFPNRGNPNRIRAQRYRYRVPADPQPASESTPLRGVFGIAVNGVPFDPGAAEFYRGQSGTQWQYEPLSGAINLGVDMSHAHVQPTGAYHYHGLPTGLLERVRLDPGAHSPLVGWAADGFPIYALYGYADPKDAKSEVVPMKSSYRLKSGSRPGGNEPGGRYDGTFVGDYEYADRSGDLDECNGRFTVTPDYPEGTYAYFLTEDWPVIPRRFRGTPSRDFMRGGPGGPGGPPPWARRGHRPPPPPGFGPRGGRRPRQ